MRGRNLTLAILLLLGAAAVGCSDDGGSDADAQPYVDALVSSLQDSDGPGPTDEQAECIAERAIDAIGVDTLEDAGVTPEEVAESDGPEDFVELSEDQARDVAESFVSCEFDFAAAFAGEDASQEAIDCIDENLDEDDLVDAFALQFQGREDEADAALGTVFGAVQAECASLFG